MWRQRIRGVPFQDGISRKKSRIEYLRYIVVMVVIAILFSILYLKNKSNPIVYQDTVLMETIEIPPLIVCFSDDVIFGQIAVIREDYSQSPTQYCTVVSVNETNNQQSKQNALTMTPPPYRGQYKWDKLISDINNNNNYNSRKKEEDLNSSDLTCTLNIELIQINQTGSLCYQIAPKPGLPSEFAFTNSQMDFLISTQYSLVGYPATELYNMDLFFIAIGVTPQDIQDGLVTDDDTTYSFQVATNVDVEMTMTLNTDKHGNQNQVTKFTLFNSPEIVTDLNGQYTSYNIFKFSIDSMYVNSIKAETPFDLLQRTVVDAASFFSIILVAVTMLFTNVVTRWVFRNQSGWFDYQTREAIIYHLNNYSINNNTNNNDNNYNDTNYISINDLNNNQNNNSNNNQIDVNITTPLINKLD